MSGPVSAQLRFRHRVDWDRTVKFYTRVPIRLSGGINGLSMEGNTMTAKETIEIISNSSLWKTLSKNERAEAAAYAIKNTGLSLEDEDVFDLIGEVYAG